MAQIAKDTPNPTPNVTPVRHHRSRFLRVKQFVKKNKATSIIVAILVLGLVVTLVEMRMRQDNQQHATSSSAVVFVDSNRAQITQTSVPTVNIILTAPWPAQSVADIHHHSNLARAGLQSVAGASTYVVYNGRLQSGWTDGSYKSTINYGETSMLYQGAQSISVQASAYGGLELNAPRRFSTGSFKYVQFAVRASQPNEDLALYAENANFSLLRSVRLYKYAGYPSTTGWTTYTVPLADLRATNRIIGDITIQNNTGKALGIFYVNQIQFVSSSTPSPATFVPTITSRPTVAPPTATAIPMTPTPAPFTITATLAEDSNFTTNVKAISPYSSNPLATAYTFSDSTPGIKTVYVKFTSTTGQTQTFSSSIQLVGPATPTAVLPTVTSVPTLTQAPTPSTPPVSGGSNSGIHVSGDKILNSAGQQVQEHGVSFSGFEYSCLTGYMNDGAIPPTQAEVTGMKTWNINTVRIPLNEDCWLGEHGIAAAVSGAIYQNAVANFVNLLTSNNMSVILNLHFTGDGTTKAVEQEPMADRAHSNDFWASVAAKFKGNSAVMFEPYNEPHLNDVSVTGGTAWPCWRDGGCTVKGNNKGDGSFVVAGMQEMLNAIRSTGAKNIVIATGEDWGADLSGWQQYKPSDPINQLVAGWHTYGDGLSCQNLSCWNSTLASVLTTNPILTTEIGEFDCKDTYITPVMNWLDSHDMQGYYAWTWGPFNCSGDPALISDKTWEGTSPTVYGAGYKAHLLTRP